MIATEKKSGTPIAVEGPSLLGSIKKIVFGLAAGLTYFLIFYNLFGRNLIWDSLLFVLIFFVCFQFFYLQVSRASLRYFFGFLLLASIGESFFVGITNYLLCIGIGILNAGIWMLAYHLQGQAYDKIRFNSRSYFNTGGYIFTVFITVGYSIILLGMYQKFPLTCQDLSDASARVVNFFTRPVEDGAKKVKTNIDNIFNTKVKDIAAIGQQISLDTSKKSTYAAIVGKINTRKKTLIDQALTSNDKVSMGICDYVLGEVNTIYNTPGFLTSVVLLLFVLLYSFVRIVFWMMAWLGFLIFKLLLLCRLYRTKKEMIEVERIE